MKNSIEKTQLGFVVNDINIVNILDSEVDALKKLVLQYGLIVLPKQNLPPQQLENLAMRMGEALKLSSSMSAGEHEDGCSKVIRVSNVLKNGEIIPNRYAATNWHTDGDFWPSPKNYVWNFLYGHTIPATGGATAFADCHRAYLTLTTEQKAYLKNKKIVVNFSKLPNMGNGNEQHLPTAKHNILSIHPVSKKELLYVSGPEAAIQVEGLNKEQSLAEMKLLHNHIIQPENLYIHNWNKGDLIIWDNLMSIHRGYGDYENQPRLLYKVQTRMAI